MNFDIKDVKSWYNRLDVKVGDKGYFGDSLAEFNAERVCKDSISKIDDSACMPFTSSKEGFTWGFFLPLDAVKEDKPKEKKYRPFKSMAEFTKVVYNLVPDYLNITGVGESFMARRKYNQHTEKVLITHLEYDANHNLISINGQPLKSLFENYEIITDDDKIIPFGVEVKND